MPQTTELPPPSQTARPAAGPAPSSSSTPPNRQRALKIGLLIAGLLLIASAVMAPLAAKWAINQYLRTQFSSAIALRHLGVNPFTGRLDVSVQKSSQLVLDRVQMEWDWLPLLQRTVRLNDVHLNGLTVEIKPLPNGGVQIGDIHLEGAVKTVSEAIESGSSNLPIFLDVRQVVLNNINVTYTDPKFQATLVFDQVQLRAAGTPGAGFLRYGLLKNSDQQLDFTGDVRLSGLALQPPVFPKADASQKSSLLQKLQGLTARVSGLVKFSGLHVELQADPKSGRLTPVFRVASLELSDNAAVQLQGQGFNKPLDVTFQPVNFQLKNLDSTKPGAETSLTLATSAGGKSNVRYSLTGKPLEKPFSLAGTGRIERFPMPPFSPLVERFIDYRILGGKLNLDPNLSVKRGRLDSTWDMVLNGFEVKKLGAAERDPMADDLDVPLASSVMLLKDKNGDIHLELPLKADLNDPNKAFASVLARAMSAGIESGARATLNKVLAPVSAGKGYTLAPLTFGPKDAALSAEAIEYLKEVGNLLVERPGLKLNIQGFGPVADKVLVAKRAENVKTHLTTTYAIVPERLPIVNPELSDDPAASPRVELSL